MALKMREGLIEREVLSPARSRGFIIRRVDTQLHVTLPGGYAMLAHAGDDNPKRWDLCVTVFTHHGERCSKHADLGCSACMVMCDAETVLNSLAPTHANPLLEDIKKWITAACLTLMNCVERTTHE